MAANIKNVLIFAGVLFTACAAVFACTIYFIMGFLNENIAYMALYFDDAAVDLYAAGANDDTVLLASATAWRFCELYGSEIRTLDQKYADLCDGIQARHVIFEACTSESDPYGYCTDEMLDLMDERMTDAQDAAKELRESRPYFGFVFSDDYRPVTCTIAGEVVPCPL